MNTCPQCGSEIKTVPAGVSKATGKPYDSFQVCSDRNCGWTPAKVKKTPPGNQPFLPAAKTQANNGNLRAMVLSYAKDVVVAEIEAKGPVDPVERIRTIFADLWDILGSKNE